MLFETETYISKTFYMVAAILFCLTKMSKNVHNQKKNKKKNNVSVFMGLEHEPLKVPGLNPATGRLQLMIVQGFIAQNLSLSPSCWYDFSSVERDVKYQFQCTSIFNAISD